MPVPENHTPTAALNPATARVQTIADPDTKPRLMALQLKLQDPNEALKFLRKIGIVDQHGALTKRFGG